ncbi:MAG: hypothetical protein ACYC8T_20720 [Myxococcaceae bacterium]
MLIRLAVVLSLLSGSLAGAAPRQKKSRQPPPPVQVAPAPEKQPEPPPAPPVQPAPPVAPPVAPPAPKAATPPPPAAPPEEKEEEEAGPRYLKLASPGFSAVNVEPGVATFLSDHFAQQLALGGIKVATATEIGALIGLERQKQLVGCSDDAASCLAELAGALGADGLITGSVARFGGTFQINIKIISARDGAALSVVSRTAKDEESALGMLTQAASELAPLLLKQTERDPNQLIAQSQTQLPLPLNLVTITMGFAGLGFYGLQYERAVFPWLGLFLAPSFVKSGFMLPQGESGQSFELVLGVRGYLAWNAPKGFFGSLQVGLGYGTRTWATGRVAKGPAVMPGGTLGYTWLIARRVPISIGGGLGYGVGDYLGTPLLLLLRLNTGVAF